MSRAARASVRTVGSWPKGFSPLNAPVAQLDRAAPGKGTVESSSLSGRSILHRAQLCLTQVGVAGIPCKVKKTLDAKHKISYNVGHEQARCRQARPNPLHALRGRFDALVSRLADVSINTVSKLLEDAGRFCAGFHDAKVRNVKAKRVQVDEIWTFTSAKQKNVARDESAGRWRRRHLDLDRDRGPDQASHFAFRRRPRRRLRRVVHGGRCRPRRQPHPAHSDGHKAYLEAVEGAFGADIDYAMLVKIYGARRGREGPLQPGRMHRR